MTDSTKPKFFLLGDSISIHYTPFLRERMAPWADLARKGGDEHKPANLDKADALNGGDSTACLDYLYERLQNPKFKYDWILLNCGLHDIKRNVKPPRALQVPPEKYEANLNEIIFLMQRYSQRLCWISSTPAFEDVHNKPESMFHRFHADIQYYNALAAGLCKANNIPIIDLYAFTLPHCPGAFCDHVHFTEEIRALQAEFLEMQIRKLDV